jgi:hypothetical protein
LNTFKNLFCYVERNLRVDKERLGELFLSEMLLKKFELIYICTCLREEAWRWEGCKGTPLSAASRNPNAPE